MASARGFCETIAEQHRARPGLHDPRSRRQRRPAEPRAPRSRILTHRKPLSHQGDMPCHLFTLRQFGERRSTPMLRDFFPWCSDVGADQLKRSLRRLCRSEAGAERARLRRPAALLGAYADMSTLIAEDIGSRFDHVLVDEYQDTNRLAVFHPARAEARWARIDRRRRRRAVDLFLSRGDGAQHPRFSQGVYAGCRDRHARPQLPIDAADPRPLPMP
jgi:hypothetical protein